MSQNILKDCDWTLRNFKTRNARNEWIEHVCFRYLLCENFLLKNSNTRMLLCLISFINFSLIVFYSFHSEAIVK